LKSDEILIKNIFYLLTMDNGLSPLKGVDLLIKGNLIERIDKVILPEPDTQTIDGSSMIILPGFINTHHHLYQTLTRNIPKVQNSKLFDWLVNLYEIWRGLTPEAVHTSALTGMAELILTGCTTTSDHFYLYPDEAPTDLLDSTINAAQEIGIRFMATRGGMSRGRSLGGLPPDNVCQSAKDIIEDYQRVISKYGNSEENMIRIALAPCSPFSINDELMRATVRTARENNIKVHTHLAETIDEEDYCLEKYGKRPLAVMEDLGWVGEDVWFAHGIHFNDEELKRLAQTKTGIAHCPVSNLRLGSGIARVPEMLQMGIPVGLAVDGSASNDSSNMLRELQTALLVHRIGSGVESMPKEEVLKMATINGAQILGFDRIGSIKEGYKADIIGYRLDDISYAGALSDPAAAILFSGRDQTVSLSIINGQIVVKDKEIQTVNLNHLITKQNRLSEELINKAIKNTGINFLEY
jgi:cytosine/adenosine deaminase-related metal-dependent hydrolase